MCDWVTRNSTHLQANVEHGDVYGLLDGDWVYIIGSTFRSAASDGGFSPSSLLSWMRERGLIQTRGRAMTKNKRINGIATECVCMCIDAENMQLKQDGYEEIDGFPI